MEWLYIAFISMASGLVGYYVGRWTLKNTLRNLV